MKQFFRDIFDFFTKNNWFFFVNIAALIVGVVVGLCLPLDTKYYILDMVFNKIPQADTVGLGRLFFNNLQTGLIIIISGLLIVLPLLIVLFNGVVIGALASIFVSLLGWKTVLIAMVLPGVFQVVAIILAGTLGTILAYKILGRFKDNKWLDIVAKISIVLFGVVVPLLFVASLIEHNISRRYIPNLKQNLSE